jgi:ABC-type branched-subunit amino acid transport system substrate-binding protein
VRGAVQARIDVANTHGGVHNRQIDIEWRDDESSSVTFGAAARELVDNAHVFGLVAQTAALDRPAADWLQSAGVPVTGLATSALWGEYPDLFHFGSLFNEGGAVDTFGRYVKAQGGSKAFLVTDPNAAASQGLATQLVPSLESQGIELVGRTTYSASTSSPTKIVDLMRKDGADALVGVLSADGFIDIYAAAKAAGTGLHVALSANNYGPAALRQRGADMAGMSMTMAFQSYTSNSPAIQAYSAAMADYAPEVANPFDDIAITAYAAADEMITGLQLAGACPTRQSFITSLRKVRTYDAGGLMAPTDISRPGDPATCFNFLKVNKTGTGFAPVPGNTPTGFWCGTKIAS